MSSYESDSLSSSTEATELDDNERQIMESQTETKRLETRIQGLEVGIKMLGDLLYKIAVKIYPDQVIPKIDISNETA